MFGKRIRKLRLEQNLKQKDLAAKLGISTSSVGMYEREERQPDVETLKKIADFFMFQYPFLHCTQNSN